MKIPFHRLSDRRALSALFTLFAIFSALPASAISIPQPISPPTLSAPNNASGTYDISWSSGFDSIQLYESPNGTASWSLKYSGDASAGSKSFDYDYGGIRHYRAKGCASIDGNVPSCSEYSATISVNASGSKEKPATAVILGDSFSSGEGGRWRGNTNDQESRFSGFHDTDPAGFNLQPIPGNPGANWDRVYEANSIDNGCHRAFSAPIHGLSRSYFPLPPLMIKGPFQETVNLACSGARNKHLWPLAEGGESFKGEIPQITQLAKLNLTHEIKLIAVGIGGNDMGFSNAIGNCLKAWFVKHWGWEIDNWVDDHCDSYIAGETIPELWDVYGKTALTINLIRQEMLRQGKTDPDDYRIVLMGYPDIIAGFSDNRYDSGDRRSSGRCPFNGPDSRYVVNTLMPKLNGMYETLAHDESVDFINPKDLFQGHKPCQSGANRASSSTPATAGNMEWVRYIDLDLNTRSAISTLWDVLANGTEIVSGEQGRVQESMHPNQFGQEALGSCYRNWWQQRGSIPGPYKCDNANPDSTTQVKLKKLPSPTSGHISGPSPIPDARILGEAPGGAIFTYMENSAAR